MHWGLRGFSALCLTGCHLWKGPWLRARHAPFQGPSTATPHRPQHTSLRVTSLSNVQLQKALCRPMPGVSMTVHALHQPRIFSVHAL